MTQRIRRHPFLALFDGADPNSSTPSRNVTTVPTQALFFLNDPLVHREAERFADRLIRSGADDRNRVDLAYRLAFARPATEAESDQAIHDLGDFRAELIRGGADLSQAVRQAWASLARTLLASNEFAYVD